MFDKIFTYLRVAVLPVSVLLAVTADARETVQIEKDVNYLGAGRSEKADLYLPADAANTKKRPAVVIIHGGGWTGGDKGAAREQNIGTTLATNGYVALSINYLLQPTDGPRVWPKNLHDCKTAVRWLRANAERLRIDQEHIGVIGGSAGGHLAAMLGLSGPESGLDPEADAPFADFSCRVQAVVDLYGPMAHQPERIETLLGPNALDNPELRRQVTPLSHIDKTDPPVLILHGTADTTVPVADSELFAEALNKAGVKHELIIIPGAPHTFHLQPKQQDLRPVVLKFFDKHLKSR
jgi:acetyl esterase/lipase